jgi:hypothetical protein
MTDKVTKNLDSIFVEERLKRRTDDELKVPDEKIPKVQAEIVETSTDAVPTSLDKINNPSFATVEAEEDFGIIRNNMQSIIEQGAIALTGILELAQAADSPRAYEVVATLIKTLSESNAELMNHHKKIAELRGNDNGTANDISNIENAIFVGSTHELQKFIKEKRNDAIDSNSSS